MKDITHVMISIGAGLFFLSLYNFFIPLGFLFFFFGFIFAIIGHACDWLDFKIFRDHNRNFLTHSPLSPLLICIAIVCGILFSIINIFLGIYCSFIVYLIFFLHFLLDALNPSGVPLLPKSRIRLLTIPYNSIKWNGLLMLIGIILGISGTFLYALRL
ncbi:MAG: hypothetical protein ACTSR8_14150 [Promethearchaeota archaeon]